MQANALFSSESYPSFLVKRTATREARVLNFSMNLIEISTPWSDLNLALLSLFKKMRDLKSE